MTWYKVKCKVCNNNIMVEHKTELPILCPFCRQETLVYESSVSDKDVSAPASSTTAINLEAKKKVGRKKAKRMSSKQVKKLWNLQEQIRQDSKEMKMPALIEKYKASYPVLRKIINGTWRPKLGERVAGPGRKSESTQ